MNKKTGGYFSVIWMTLLVIDFLIFVFAGIIEKSLGQCSPGWWYCGLGVALFAIKVGAVLIVVGLLYLIVKLFRGGFKKDPSELQKSPEELQRIKEVRNRTLLFPRILMWVVIVLGAIAILLPILILT